MQQVRESDLPPVRALDVVRRRSRGSGRPQGPQRAPAGRRARSAVVCRAAPPLRRHRGRRQPARRRARARGATTSRSSPPATRAPRRASSRTFAESRSDDLGLTQPELLHALTCVHEAHRFDVVSDHTGALGLALSNLTSTPFVNTVHGTLAGEAGALYRRVCEVTPGAALVSLTESHRCDARAICPGPRRFPNAIALDDHPCRAEQGRRVPLLARPHVGGQGPGDRDRGRARLRHAACCSPASCAARTSRRTSRRRCEPLLGGGIDYVGEIDLHERVRLLHGARRARQPARLGRAVRARDGRGHGLRRARDRHAARLGARDRDRRETRVDRGDASTDMAAAVERCAEIDPRECRAVAERHYSPERMVGDYVDAFHDVIERARQGDSARSARHAVLSSRRGFRTGGTGENGAVLTPEKGISCSPCYSSCYCWRSCSAGSSCSRSRSRSSSRSCCSLVGLFGGYSYRGRRTV